MAEALGIASGVTALVTIAAQLTKLSYNLIVDIKNAPRVQKQYLQEVSALTDVLLRADSACEAATRVDLGIQRPDSLNSNTLLDWQRQLLSLKFELEAGVKRLYWPLREKETKRHIEQLQRFQSILNDFLSANILHATTETYMAVDKSSRESAKDRYLQWLEKYLAPSLPLPTACPDTGQWFLKGDTYQTWVQQAPSIMWIHGAPGSGKSMLSSIVVRNLQESRTGTPAAIAYFFCDYSSRKQQGTVTVLLSVLHQIVTDGDESMIEPLQKLRNGASREPSVAEVSEMLVLACTLTKRPCLVIDALDELEDARAIAQLLPKLVKAACRVLITSRPMPQLEKDLANSTHVELHASPEDLHTFIKGRFEASHGSLTATKNNDLVDAIAQRASGVFLLARIFVDHLLDLTTIKQMRKALPNLPTHLGEAYDSSIRRIDEQPPPRRSLAYRVIAWITHAERRLTVDDLVHAFAVEKGDDELDEDNFLDPRLILQVCVGLVTLHSQDRRLGMVHTTAYEYFRDRNSDDVQEDMASTCLAYMQLRPLLSGPCIDVATMKGRLADMPFLGYAANYFAEHTRDGELEVKLGSAINALLQNDPLSASAWQAIHYRAGLTDTNVASELLNSIPHSQNAVHLAAFWNLSHTLASLLDKCYDPSARDSQDWTPLHWACSRESREAVELLVLRGSELNAKDSVGWSPIFWFALKGNVEGLQTLLQRGADHLLRDSHNWTALHWAISAQQKAAISALLAHHKRTVAGNHPFIPVRYSTSHDQNRATSSDARYGLSLINTRGSTELDLYGILADADAGTSSVDVERLLSDDFFDPPAGNVWRTLNKRDYIHSSEWEQGQKLFRRAIRDSKVSAVKGLVAIGVDVNSPDRNGLLPLHQAIMNGFLDMALILLQAGADVNAAYDEKDLKGGIRRSDYSSMAIHVLEGATVRSPLMLACGIESKHPEQVNVRSQMVSLLRSHKADVNAKDDHGGSVLHYAAISGDFDIVRQLTDAGADINARHDSGMSVLHCAAACGSLSPLVFLMDAGADLDAKDDKGRGAVHYWAASRRSYNTAEMPSLFSLFVSRYGVSVLDEQFDRGTNRWFDSETYQGHHTPLSLALEAEVWDLVRLLHHAGASFPADCTVENKSKYLADAVRSAGPDIVQMMINLSPELDLTVEASREYGGFGFFYSPDKVDADLANLQVLQRAGMDISFRRNVTLSRAIEHKAARPVIRALLDMGADPFGPSPYHEGRDVFMDALLMSNPEALECLVDHALEQPRDGHWTINLKPTTETETSALQNMCVALQQSDLLDSYRDSSARSILWISSEKGDLGLCKALIDAGIVVDQEDLAGWRSLHIASYHGHDAIVKELLLHGADPCSYTEKWSQDLDGSPVPLSWWAGENYWRGQALHLAAFGRHPGVVRILLAEGIVDVNAKAHYFEGGLRGSEEDGRLTWKPECQPTEQTALSLILRPQDRLFTSAERHADEIAGSDEAKAVIELLCTHGAEHEESANP